MASVEEMKQELRTLTEQAHELVTTLEAVDGVTAASQLARLDLATLLLAIVSLLLVFGGLFAFGFVRGQAGQAAKSAAEDIAEKRLTALLQQIEGRMDAFDNAAKRAKQPTSRPSTEGAEKASSAGEFKSGDEQ